ncbi:CBS domain-containing protein [Candidatus Woesearchaeota archaeon]|nr:CBS domain-containing protein [Candidatus Woesearchaeota archaeon]
MNVVSDIMHSTISIDKNMLVSDAAFKMSKHNRGSILVTDQEKHVGIFTERDILRIVADNLKVAGSKISKHYTKNLITVDEKTTLNEASRILSNNNIRRLPVTRDNKIVGMVTANSIGKNLRFMTVGKMLSGSFAPSEAMSAQRF